MEHSVQTQRDLAASAILPSQPPLHGCDFYLVDLSAQVNPSSEGSGHVALLRHKSYLSMSSSVPLTLSPPVIHSFNLYRQPHVALSTQ